MEKSIKHVIKCVNTHTPLQNGSAGSVDIGVMSEQAQINRIWDLLVHVVGITWEQCHFLWLPQHSRNAFPGISPTSVTEGIEVRDSHRCCKAGQDPPPQSGGPPLSLRDFFRLYIRIRHLQESFGALLRH